MKLAAPRLRICSTAIVALLVQGPLISLRAQDVPRPARNAAAVNLPSLSPLVERVMPAVVNISVVMDHQAAAPIAEDLPDSAAPDSAQQDSDDPGDAAQPPDDLLRHFFERHGRTPPSDSPSGPAEELMALGSGFIVDPAGYIVTNNHVVANSKRTTVILQDNSRHQATLIGRDEKTDLALLKIDSGRPLPFLRWGDSDAAKVGDWVVAVGNPFGLGGTVTAGIVSARGRDIGTGPYDRFLQIDAPINRGNSGGPTFDLQGEVIGINTAIFSPSGGSVGIGFAIPSNFAHLIVDQLQATGHVERGWLGVSIQPLTAAIARAFGADPTNPAGALVDNVRPGGPAAAAGIKRGDIIAAVDGEPVRIANDLPRLVAMSKVGQKLHVTVERDRARQILVATIARQPTGDQRANADGDAVPSAPPRVGTFGIALRPLTAELRLQLHSGPAIQGVVVENLLPGSPAARLGLRPGDIIESINRVAIDTPDAADAKLRDAVSGGAVVLFVDRDGTGQFVGMSADPP